MKADSMDLRIRVLEDSDSGATTRQTARKYRVSEAWVRRLKQRRRQTGETAPRSSSSKRKPSWIPHLDAIRELVALRPDLTLAEIRTELKLAIRLTTLWRAVKGAGLTLKKSYQSRRAGPRGRRRGPRAMKGEAADA